MPGMLVKMKKSAERLWACPLAAGLFISTIPLAREMSLVLSHEEKEALMLVVDTDDGEEYGVICHHPGLKMVHMEHDDVVVISKEKK